MDKPTTAEIQERHDSSVHQSMGDLALDEIDVEIVPELLNAYNECRTDREILLDKLKMYEDFDASPDNAEWEPPHPIFLLSEERDSFMRQFKKAESLLRVARCPNSFCEREQCQWCDERTAILDSK